MRRRWFIMLALPLLAGLALGLWPQPGRQPQAPVSTAVSKTSDTFSRTPAGSPRAEGNVLFRVVDGRHKPLSDVPIQIWSRGIYDPAAARFRWIKQPALRTGKDGTARTSLDAGAHYAAAHAPGFAPARKAFSRLTEVVLVAPAPVSLGGRVEDAITHEPIPLADLKLIPTAAELEFAEPPEEEQAHVASGPDGRFLAQNLPAGSYLIEGQATGYGRTRTPELDVPDSHVVVRLRAAAFIEGRVLLPDGTGAAGAEITASHARDPSIAEADANGAFSLQIDPGAFLLSARSGQLAMRVTKPLAAKAGATLNVGILQLHQGGAMDVEVLDHAGQPVSSAEVIVSPVGFDGATGSGKTSETGHALVKALPEGSYDLDVLAKGHGRYFERGLVVAPSQTISHKVLLAGEGAIEGTVRDGRGDVVEGALVRANSLSRPFSTAMAATARTDAAGRYHLEGVPEGTAHVAAVPSEQAAMGAPRSVEVLPDNTVVLDLILEASATIKGRVSGNEPGKRAMVMARLAQNLRSSLDRAESPLDEEGRYSLQVPPGRWWVLPYHPSQLSETRAAGKSVEVSAGEILKLDLSFDEGNDVATGQVLEPGGAPASFASLIFRAKERNFEFLRADEDGRFRLMRARELPEETHVIARKGGRSADVPFSQGELTIQLHEAAAIHGRVTSGGQPATGFVLNVVPAVLPGWAQPGPYQISGAGFALDDVISGPVVVTCALPDGASASQQITLMEGEDRPLDFDVVVAARIHGRILGGGGEPLAGVLVRAFPGGEGAGVSATTSATGAFSMPLPARGLVVVAANIPGRRMTKHVQVDQDDLDLGDLRLEDDSPAQ